MAKQKKTKKLQSLRSLIDQVDEMQSSLLAFRLMLVSIIGSIKTELKMKITDKNREMIVIKKAKSRAKTLGISPEFVEKIMTMQIRESKRIQKRK